MSNSSSNPFKDFKDIFLPIKDKFEQLPVVLLELIDYSDKIIKENEELKEQLNKKEEEIKEIKTQYEETNSSIEKIKEQNKEYEEKLAKVEENMKKFREMYEELASEKAKEIDVEELLAIYSILFENVFAANPHTKILLLLQGTDKKEWTRGEIVKTTGIAPAAVLRVLYDLRNNGIIELDDDNKTVRLVQKLV